jgi:hypothetical protein
MYQLTLLNQNLLTPGSSAAFESATAGVLSLKNKQISRFLVISASEKRIYENNICFK